GEADDAVDVDARKPGRIGIGADRIDMASEYGTVQHYGDGNGDRHHQDDRIGDAGKDDGGKAVIADIDDPEERSIAEHAEGIAKARYGARTGDLQRNAARDQHHAERRDEGRQLHPGDQDAVDPAADGAGQDAETHADRHGYAPFLDGECRHHAG